MVSHCYVILSNTINLSNVSSRKNSIFTRFQVNKIIFGYSYTTSRIYFLSWGLFDFRSPSEEKLMGSFVLELTRSDVDSKSVDDAGGFADMSMTLFFLASLLASL